jgi:hypothetical protein
MARGHISLSRMRRYRGLFRPSGAFFQHPFSADYTISMFGFDFRQGQLHRLAGKRLPQTQ